MFEKQFRYARIEIERRFLLAAPPTEIDTRSGYQTFEDLYFPGGALRLRRVTSPTGQVIELKLNQKLSYDPPLPTHRIMTSLYLSPADYNLLSQLGGARLVKRRYGFLWQGASFGVDVFQGDLSGLVLAEAEVESVEILNSLPTLPTHHVEVTANPHFNGGALVAQPPENVLKLARELLALA